MTIQYALKNKPIIASLVNDDDLEAMLETTSNITFLLTGNIFTLEKIVDRIKASGKLVFIHFDLLEGISKDRVGVQYLAEKISIDGIVTTRSNIILAAKQNELMTIQRLFVLDSVSMDHGIRVIKSSQPDAIEVLPGVVIPKIIDRIHRELGIPVIAGGLLTDLNDLKTSLDCGAIGISTSSRELWAWQDKKSG